MKWSPCSGLALWEREARALASLHHPNVATLYGVEDTPTGQVLLMELVEGDTLADRLALAR
jgi:serine/threonine protein kinase